MSLPQLPNTRNPRELRKALLRLRMEMHRQEIRHESGQLMEPLRRVRGMGSSLHAVGDQACAFMGDWCRGGAGLPHWQGRAQR